MKLGTIIHKWISLGLLTATLLLALLAGPGNTNAQQSSNSQALKIALLPIMDVFPYFVAEDRGYFRDRGLNVEMVPVASGLERDQLMQSGAIDGMLNEIISTANFNRNRIQVKTVSAARKAYPRYPLFRILSSPASRPRLPAETAGISVGISRNTIIEYVTDRLLKAAGADHKSIVKKSVPVIPERYQLLMQDQLEAATLPDPLAKSALEAGAGTIIDDSAHPQFSMSVLSFSSHALEKKGASVRLFLVAWDRAAKDINRDPESFRDLLLQKIRVPKNIQQTYKIPSYPRREIPTKSQWEDVMQWMVDKGLLENPLPYGDSVTAEFLP